MDYQAIKNSIHGNPVSLFRELLKYDPETVSSLLLKYDGGNSAIKEVTSKNKSTYYYSNESSTVTEFLNLVFELGYNPMRTITYNPYLKEWGKREDDTYRETYPEITSLWFDLSDSEQCLLLEKTGKENIQSLVTQGYHFLHHAFKQNHYKTIEILSTFDLDYNAKDNFGKSVREHAENNPISLDLYLKLNNTINPEEKFEGLKSWFINNIEEISASKYSKPEQMQKITQWLNQKWNGFTLEQKQEIFSLSIGSTTKDVFSFISQFVEDKKTLLSPDYPFWMSLDNCKVKQLAFSSIKNVHPITYHSDKDVFFVEKLAVMFKNFNLPIAMSQPTPKDDLARIKALGESYGKYKDMWLAPVKDGDPLFHTIAKRKNEVFKMFGNNWLNLDSANDLLGNSNASYSYLMDDSNYTVQRHDNQGSVVNVIKLKIQPIKLSALDIFKQTWMHKDKDDKYTFEYFLENHYDAISYNYKPKVLESLKDLMKNYYSYSEDKTLPEKKRLELESEYKKFIEPLYPIDAVFKLLVSCSKIYDKMSGYNIYGLDAGQISATMRSCYNIVSLDEYKDMFDYSAVTVPSKLKQADHMLHHDLGALVLERKLNRDLSSKAVTKQLKI
jgi:hypothetical protein